MPNKASESDIQSQKIRSARTGELGKTRSLDNNLSERFPANRRGTSQQSGRKNREQNTAQDATALIESALERLFAETSRYSAIAQFICARWTPALE